MRDEEARVEARWWGDALGKKPPLSPKHKQSGCVSCHTRLPNKGTASDVAGIVSATMFRNTVRERRIVTPGRRKMKLKGLAHKVKCCMCWVCESMVRWRSDYSISKTLNFI